MTVTPNEPCQLYNPNYDAWVLTNEDFSGSPPCLTCGEDEVAHRKRQTRDRNPWPPEPGLGSS